MSRPDTIEAIIVEDEKYSQKTLESLIQTYCQGIEVTGIAGSVSEALDIIEVKSPHLVFMDVELNSGTGFDVLRQIPKPDFDIIFTTAFEHYAIKAIKFSSIDYLLKPIDIEELKAAILKVREKVDRKIKEKQVAFLLNNLSSFTPDYEKICLPTFDGFEFINVEDIIYCEAKGSYTIFHLDHGGTIMVSKHLKEQEQLLSEFRFLRVHHSYLVNLRKVKKLVKSSGGYLLMSNGDEVSISQSKRNEFLERMRLL